MHLQFHHHGKQFFFFTACLQGRPQVLSTFAEGEKRPILTPLGEAVQAVLIGTHGRNPALTMSDYVIMPDHVHFLLIADYDPSLEDSRAIANGQLLILSSFPPDVPGDSITRSNCELMNSRILALCGAAAEPIQTVANGRGGSALPAPHPGRGAGVQPPTGWQGVGGSAPDHLAPFRRKP